jgi:hypothetical protein
MASAAKDLFNTELRLRQLLAPYGDKLEQATIYGIPCLRRKGAGAQDWFAFIKTESKFVSLYLLPVYSSAELRRSMSPALAKRQSGKATFHFRDLDEAMAAEVEALLARAFDIYMAESEPEKTAPDAPAADDTLAGAPAAEAPADAPAAEAPADAPAAGAPST